MKLIQQSADRLIISQKLIKRNAFLAEHSNGITEGFHRKMKLIQGRAYGFRNFENYRIRVRVLCA
ncbi:MAG: transposase [Legionellaceae bacterium]|nr:transposase [Legionellaceae bacterium]